MKIRGYRIRINHDGVGTIAKRLFKLAIAAIIPYSVGRFAIYLKPAPGLGSSLFPVPAEIWALGMVLLLVAGFCVLILAWIVDVLFGLLIEIEEVEDRGE